MHTRSNPRRSPHTRLVLLATLAALAHTPAFPAVLITEVVTDPQLDHSDSAGGNGVPFDAVAGNGTVSDTDEFVELFNGGSSAVDLTGFSLDFTDGTPTTLDFAAPGSAVLRFSQADDSIARFSPGTFIVVGNPPGSLNNSLTVTLRTGSTVIDQIVVDDANAGSEADEAHARVWTGSAFSSEFVQARASLGAPVTPVPEPATGLLCLAGLAMLALAARARR